MCAVFGDRRAKFRSYWNIETVAEKARVFGQVTAHSQFNICDFISGPLKLRINGEFDIEIYKREAHEMLAFVTFHKSNKVSLNVSESIWLQAQNGFAFAKFVLAHEVGHILLHKHDALAYSQLIPSRLAQLDPLERTEPQADLFADLFLVPTSMLNRFDCADDIAEYFNVPIECAQRRFDLVSDKIRRQAQSHAGEACPECANFTLVRNGTCMKCDTCGGTTGCS